MSRRARPSPFGDVVAELKAAPRSTEQPRPGLHNGEWTTPEGTTFRLVDDRLSPEGFQLLSAGGAEVVFDSCGCGGGCRLEWLRPAEAAALAAVGPPRLLRGRNRRAELHLWQAEDGRQLLVAAMDVTWGDRF